MKMTFDIKTIQTINIFQDLTGSNVVDCINNEHEICFVVAKGSYGLAVGRNGAKIKNAERVFKKHIRIFEHSSDLDGFVKNLIPDADDITKTDDIVSFKLKHSAKAKAIGRRGENIKLVKELLNRHFGIKAVKIR
ncbi:MAG: NusA-like transcription termination signal-binding factor [Candidatus Aenigmatarchaeota archaeon]